MNYRHIYHAGNACDVVKHAALTLLLAHLCAKETPFAVLDTHAGIGAYDLNDERAAKTAEAQAGIVALLGAERLPELTDYYTVLTKVNPAWNNSPETFRYYPGSPLIALHMMRPQDRLIACDLHEEDAATLKRTICFRRDYSAPAAEKGAVATVTAPYFPFKQAQVHHRDGFAALKAFLPFAEKRGLVLIDPPFEQPDDFDRMVDAVREAHQRMRHAMMMLWYPVKERPTIWQFHEKLVATAIPKMLAAEFIFHEETRSDRLNGSGLVFINPPWGLDEKLRDLLSKLHGAMGTDYAKNNIMWLSDEVTP